MNTALSISFDVNTSLSIVGCRECEHYVCILCFYCHMQAEVMQDFSRRCQYPSLECVRQASSSRRGYPPGTWTGFLDGSSSRTAASKGYQLSRSSSNSSNNTIRYLSTALGSTDDSSIEDCSSDEDTSAACYPSGNLRAIHCPPYLSIEECHWDCGCMLSRSACRPSQQPQCRHAHPAARSAEPLLAAADRRPGALRGRASLPAQQPLSGGAGRE